MGAAAVLLDGRLVDAELLLAAQAGGHEVTTAESIEAPAGELHPIQAALLDAGAIQSGYTAGAVELQRRRCSSTTPTPTRRRSGTRCPASSTGRVRT